MSLRKSVAKQRRVLITPRLPIGTVDDMRARLEPRFHVVYSPTHPGWSAQDLGPMLRDVDGVIAGGDMYTERSLESASRLEVISRFGTGYDMIDVPAASRRGIFVTNTPGANSDAVADFTLGLILALLRSLPSHDGSIKAGAWLPKTGRELSELNLGLVGFGAIGSRVARRARAFDMNVIAFDPVVSGNEGLLDIKFGALADVLKEADVVSLHLPLSNDTRGLVDRGFLAAMRPGSYLINTARGGIVDQEALLSALDSGHVAGAGLDVFASEPPIGLTQRLAKHPHVIASAHVAGDTFRAVRQSAHMAVESIVAVFDGKIPDHCINPEALAARESQPASTR